MPRLSVIIATHKRAKILQRCLEHLEKQTIAPDLEVIVVSDGHDPATASLFDPAVSDKRPAGGNDNEALTANRYALAAIRFMEIPKSQQAVARNRGLDKSTAPYALFIGDDIFLAPDACEKHLAAHEAAQKLAKTNRVAVLGFTTWDPAVGITPVMEWLEETGWQFGYPLLKPYAQRMIPRYAQHRFTYTSNISIPTALAREHQFREDVTLYGWEDTEWGVRLRQDSIGLYYEPDAKALHHHHVTLDDSLKRMETLGRSAVIVSQMNPELDRLPKGWKRMAYKLIAKLPTMRGKHAGAFLRGIAAGER